MATKRKISQSFYNDITGIVQNKGKWHTATSKGEDATPFAEAAKPSYTSLRDGGYGDIADSLEKMDYTQALAYLDNFEVDAPKGYAEQLDDLYGRQAYKSDETFDTIVADKDTLFNDWNDYLKDVRAGYTGTDYYNSIAQTYAELGDEAVLGALASGGAENAGNIDSYAKAQAQRQQIAYKNAGEAAALGQYNAIMDNLYKGVTGKGNIAVQGWNAMQDNVTGDQSLYANMYSDLVAADAAVKEAEHNSLAEKYKAQTAFENSVYERAYELTDRWAEGLEEPPSPEEYAKYYNDAVTALQGSVENKVYLPGDYYIDSPAKPASEYTEADFEAVISRIADIANEGRLTPQQRQAEILKYIGKDNVSGVLTAMGDEYRSRVDKILDSMYITLPDKGEDHFAPTTNVIK